MTRRAPEWNRVLISGLRHYYVNRFTGVVTCRMYGEPFIGPRPDRMHTLPPAEVSEALARAQAWVTAQRLLCRITIEPTDAEA